MSLDEFINRTWCDISNLQAICIECHNEKTKREKQIKKELKNGKPTQKRLRKSKR